MTLRTIGLAMAILLIEDVASVRVFMKADVRFQLGDEKAIIPCSFNRTKTAALYNILWESNTGLGPRVLERDSSGAVFIGPQFKETASLGEGCTLILQYPKPEHSGTYWVTVIVVGEGADTKAAELNVRNDTTVTKPNIPDQTPVNEYPTTPSTDHPAEQAQPDVGYNLGFIIIGVVILTAVCYIIYIRYRRCENKK